MIFILVLFATICVILLAFCTCKGKVSPNTFGNSIGTVHTIKAMKEYDFSSTFKRDGIEFISSSPCIMQHNKHKNHYLMNIRYVNYTMLKGPPFYILHSENISSLNKCLHLDGNFNVLKDEHMNYGSNVLQRTGKYRGVEDIRIFMHNDIIYCIGTAQRSKGNLGLFFGKYNIPTAITGDDLNLESATKCEKNWSYIPDETKIQFVYSWHPLTIIEKERDSYNVIVRRRKEMPKFFTRARGSTSGFLYKNEIWFVIHFSASRDGHGRKYYHSLSVFDKNMDLKRFSKIFTMEEEDIEFVLGLVVEDNRIILSYSTWDKSSKVKIYDKRVFSELMNFP